VTVEMISFNRSNESSSFGEEERKRRHSKILTCAVTSALAAANAPPEAPMRGGSRPERRPARDRVLCHGVVVIDKGNFNRLGLVGASLRPLKWKLSE
jgi:hypothetical protein